MDTELKFLLTLSRHLPQVRGMGRFGELLKGFYLRKPRNPLVADVLGFKMQLDPAQFVDSYLLFIPQLYDFRELRALQSSLHAGDTFLDVGAYNGFYSLFASGRVGAAGRVLAIEANPATARNCAENLRLNGVANVELINCGVSDRVERLRLGIVEKNCGSSSFLAHDKAEGVEVPCYPLAQILRERNVTTIQAAKFDIEGYGCRVLCQFLKEWEPRHLPRTLIVEKEPGLADHLRRFGYRVSSASALNDIAIRREARTSEAPAEKNCDLHP